MSLLNQPTFRAGTLVRKIDTAFSSTAASISQILPMGNNVTSCQFATSDTSIITINQTGKYRIYFISYSNILFQSLNGGGGSANSSFSITAGGTTFGLAQTIGTSFSSSFSSSLYVDFGSTSLAGSLPAYNGSGSVTGGFTANCYLSASAEVILNSTDQIRLDIVRGFIASGPAFNIALNGYIFIEQIS